MEAVIEQHQDDKRRLMSLGMGIDGTGNYSAKNLIDLPGFSNHD
jgi:hypothetical protein